jgi:putative MATE family efflux protein
LATSSLSLARQLWSQTWPMIMGATSLLGFNLVDSVFVARLGTEPLAAQSFTFPLHFLIIGVQVGIGIAIAALISRAIGAEQHHRAQRLGALVFFGGGLLMAALALVLWAGQDWAFALLGADAPMREVIRPYWNLWLCAAWVGAMLYFGYSIFRAHGNTRLPGTMMMITSLLNVCLDPLLIFGWGPVEGLGLEGAALATLISFSIGLVVVSVLMAGRGWLERAHVLEEARHSAGPFAHIAGPAMVSQLMPPLAAMLATGIVARIGEQSVAAWGLASRLEAFSIVMVLGLTMALPPWLGKCYGAGNWTEIRHLMRIAARAVVVWQLLLGLTLALISRPLAGWLVEDPAVQDHLAILILCLPPSYSLLGVCMLVVSASNALGWPVRAMLISFMRLFVWYLPLLWLGKEFFGFTGLVVGAACGNLLAGACAWGLYRQAERRATA